MIFEESLIVTLPQRKSQQVGWFFAATVLGYAGILSSLLVTSILLVNPQLKDAFRDVVLVAPPPPPPPPPPPGAVKPLSPSTPVVSSAFVPPTEIPKELPNVADLPTVGSGVGSSQGGVPGGVEGGVPGGTVGGILGGVFGATPVAVAAPPPVQPETIAAPAKPRIVSKGVLLGNSLRRVTASYPTAARAARIQDTVEVEVVIDVNGNVVSARALSGNPLLRRSATEAALQWKFKPTLLNGRPTQITGVLSFNFHLSA